MQESCWQTFQSSPETSRQSERNTRVDLHETNIHRVRVSPAEEEPYLVSLMDMFSFKQLESWTGECRGVRYSSFVLANANVGLVSEKERKGAFYDVMVFISVNATYSSSQWHHKWRPPAGGLAP